MSMTIINVLRRRCDPIALTVKLPALAKRNETRKGMSRARERESEYNGMRRSMLDCLNAARNMSTNYIMLNLLKLTHENYQYHETITLVITSPQ